MHSGGLRKWHRYQVETRSSDSNGRGFVCLFLNNYYINDHIEMLCCEN